MSTLLRAWRVVCRTRGRPWADGKNFTKGPIPSSSSTHSSPLPDHDMTEFQMVGVHGFRHEHVRPHLGHHRGQETFAYLVELHITPDIVAMPPGDDCDALVNPANEALQGTRFDPTQANEKFPHSGGRVYPEQTVDGAVTIAGGAAMYEACQAFREIPSAGSGVRCPVGSAVATPAHGELRNTYRAVVHAVPPKLGDFQLERRLVQTYRSALDVAWGHGTSHAMSDGPHMHPDEKLPPMMVSKAPKNNPTNPTKGSETTDDWDIKKKSNAREGGEGASTRTAAAAAAADDDAADAANADADPSLDLAFGRVAMPLLGAGTRGVPVRLAAKAAAEAVADYTPPQHLSQRVQRGGSLHPGEEAPMLFGAKFSVRFAVQDDEAAEELERALELHLGQCYVALSTATGEYKSSKNPPPASRSYLAAVASGRSSDLQATDDLTKATAMATTTTTPATATTTTTTRRRRRRRTIEIGSLDHTPPAGAGAAAAVVGVSEVVCTGKQSETETGEEKNEKISSASDSDMIMKRHLLDQREFFLYRLTETWSGYGGVDPGGKVKHAGGKGEGPWSSAITNARAKKAAKMKKREDRRDFFLYRLTGCWSGGKAGPWRSSS